MTEREQRMMPVPDGLAGMRVDAGLSKLLGLSRTVVADLAAAGDITAEGKSLGKSDRLVAGQWLDVTLPAPERDLAAEPPQLVEGMDILYSDDDVIAVNKPVGVAAHPTLGWEGPTVTAGLAAAGFRISTSGPPERKGIVQRLDVGTSGVMIVAASERAYTHLKRAFRNREVQKIYHALVQGHPDPTSGTIDAPIGRHPSAGWRFAVRDDGKHAVTHYDTLEAHRQASLLRVNLETGRTHQIRVHFSSLHHPLCGDPMYGSDPALSEKLGLIRQWLHAVSLRFEHPTGRMMQIDSPYPEDLQQALDRLREANDGI
ncbi:RluA family pseudouridine synthase [Corynebacterium urealyticum]|uniref:Pseudouridine synthase n=1 Tax=Corynebacterium urealyticum (strain ATCC 43042 / DSM 7109) TaxID=504474 RepID=B1VHA9_CORU7|nr:RluA family pseudouridine synthase [Corynebacterium urealyticum]AGE36763.1 pseudouridylate synthase D [Corynebacterium urealyticum DSM 7111]QQB08384.1 RluA family pseudouridine synthase [Corynebacterium urealyticum]QQC41427.1 RluA family pseudouridine synthase [Corynebacterium urealyticum]QQE50051.1 RluA family pseudouridine synthase [Corynebacterium urealyticum]TYR16221.1 RluA family pseudouridine synthase [Corynebacterium urealyticum]